MECTVYADRRKSCEIISNYAEQTGHRFAVIDQLYMGLAWGYGHAACHVIFFFLSLLPLTDSDGTYYADTCPEVSWDLGGADHMFCLACMTGS